MQRAQARLATLAIAALLVCALLWAAISARFALVRDAAAPPPAVLSEIVPPPAALGSSRPVREPESPPRPRDEQLAPVTNTTPFAAPAYSGEPLEISNPLWITRPPSPERFYPRAAFMRGIEGRVALMCFVEIDGRLSCEIEEETPPAHGFGQAALAIAGAHVMQPATINGAAVRGRYRMIVPFSID